MRTLLHILTGTARGGCETDAICLIREWPATQHHLLVLGTVGEMSDEFAAAGADVQHSNILRGGRRKVIACVEEALERIKPNGIAVWHGMVFLPEILHALRDFRGRVLVHGGNPAYSLPWWADWRYLLREKWLGQRCDAIYVCCSRYVADSFNHSRYLRRFPRVVVFNGVNALTTSIHIPRQIEPGEEATIGMVARLDEIKDHPNLLRAFALVLCQLPTTRLEIAGDGNSRDALEALAENLGIAEHVNFLGMVSDVYATMANWDLFVYATTNREGLGNALAEAMMLGLPCVVTEVGPMRELAGSTNTVSLVPDRNPEVLARAIIELIPDLPQRVALSSAALDRATAEFSGHTFAARYLGLFRS